MENEIWRIFQGIRYIEGTDTCVFIHRNEPPQESKATYNQILCDIRPQRKETHRVQLTVGSKKLTYDGPVSNLTLDLTTAKINWNSILSTPDGKYLIVYANNFQLKNIMNKNEYYNIAIKLIPQEIIDKYDRKNKQSDGYIYFRFEQVMYVLLQTGIIAHEYPKENLKPYGYALE